MPPDPINLEQLLARVAKAASDSDRVTLRAIADAVGRRSFGPLLLVAGLIVLSPIGDIPGTPSLTAPFILAIAVQLLFGRTFFWLPGWLLNRSVRRSLLLKTLRWSRRPAQFVDGWIRPRLPLLVEGRAVYGIAVFCVVIAIALPPMEVVPFSASGAGAALTAFGLALVAHDGLLALLAFAITATAIIAVAVTLL
jgi:hypothetical protein